MQARVFVVVSILMSTVCANAGEANPTQRLHAVFDRAWEFDLRDDPVAASQLGDKRFNQEWDDLSPQAWRSRDSQYAEFINEAQAVPSASLPEEEQLNRDLFVRMYQDQREQIRFKTYLRPLDQLNYSGGVLTANEAAETIEFASVQDYEDWIARLHRIPKLIDQTMALLREGLRAHSVQPRIIVERSAKQLRGQLVDDARKSPFFQPFTRFPQSIDAKQRERLSGEAETAIRDDVVPAYRRLSDFVEQTYLAKSRDTVGVWDTPQGSEFYRSRVAWFTTTNLSPEEIHQTGLREVSRIRAEMDSVIAQLGFKGSFAEFLTFLRTDPRFYYKDPNELMRAYMVMCKRIDPLLPQFFGKLPRTPYGVRPIPESSAPFTTTAYYEPLSPDGRRPGFYYVNLYEPEQRPKYEIAVLTTHEAVPGHHLQIALAQELGELPKFRRDFEATAFVEGWGLYAESLGEEMGLYQDSYDKFGQLTYEMWRAVRLVVDTGIHYKHWTRQQAIDYFKANAAKTELDITNEVDRYIAWPGQATAYKIGELKIKELRARATAQLGERFDLRAFHDLVLGSGAIPLDVLERNVNLWIETRRTSTESRP
jgi:uncharacterized protein (DUF885 family)